MASRGHGGKSTPIDHKFLVKPENDRQVWYNIPALGSCGNVAVPCIGAQSIELDWMAAQRKEIESTAADRIG